MNHIHGFTSDSIYKIEYGTIVRVWDTRSGENINEFDVSPSPILNTLTCDRWKLTLPANTLLYLIILILLEFIISLPVNVKESMIIILTSRVIFISATIPDISCLSISGKLKSIYSVARA